jgi:hypothetical protein
LHSRRFQGELLAAVTTARQTRGQVQQQHQTRTALVVGLESALAEHRAARAEATQALAVRAFPFLR